MKLEKMRTRTTPVGIRKRRQGTIEIKREESHQKTTRQMLLGETDRCGASTKRETIKLSLLRIRFNF